MGKIGNIWMGNTGTSSLLRHLLGPLEEALGDQRYDNNQAVEAFVFQLRHLLGPLEEALGDQRYDNNQAVEAFVFQWLD
ncbi:hypothetical protein QE152_g9194 [Popillia japonica]|uniref:Uncharacterized protein n=1 Tax=Popillia japonica TaxID=7064 RepID=A0AAW1LZ41_POPJA